MSTPIDWPHIRTFALAKEGGPPSWPEGVRPITMEGLQLFGLDPAYRLYWIGKPVHIERKLTLTWWQVLIAAFAAAGSLASGMSAAVTLLLKLS